MPHQGQKTSNQDQWHEEWCQERRSWKAGNNWNSEGSSDTSKWQQQCRQQGVQALFDRAESISWHGSSRTERPQEAEITAAQATKETPPVAALASALQSMIEGHRAATEK